MSKALSLRFDQASAAVDGDASILATLAKNFTANQTEREAICLELEVRAEIDSPAEYSADRMKLQVNRLSAAMGKGVKSDGKIADTRALLQSWWTTGATTPSRMGMLQQRFERARAALKGDRPG